MTRENKLKAKPGRIGGGSCSVRVKNFLSMISITLGCFTGCFGSSSAEHQPPSEDQEQHAYAGKVPSSKSPAAKSPAAKSPAAMPPSVLSSASCTDTDVDGTDGGASRQAGSGTENVAHIGPAKVRRWSVDCGGRWALAGVAWPPSPSLASLPASRCRATSAGACANSDITKACMGSASCSPILSTPSKPATSLLAADAVCGAQAAKASVVAMHATAGQCSERECSGIQATTLVLVFIMLMMATL